LFYRREQSYWALRYLEGLLLPGRRKSVESMALALAGGNVRNMQQFLGSGAWDDEALLKQHGELVAENLGDAEGVLIVDGSEFPKKGRYSAGVARQYCGIRGKIDNCQAGVFLAYAAPRGQTLLEHRLYLPEKWFEPAWRERWEQCGIPDEIAFRTKPQLAWEMIEAVVKRAVLPFSWVTCDETFGNNPEFLGHLESARIRYLADVSVSTLVWLERPETWIPPAKSSGRPPSRARVAADAPRPVRVDELGAQLPQGAWRKYQVKEGEKGPIQARFAFVRVVVVRDKLPGPELWVVLRRSLGDPAELKVFISNAPADTRPKELVRVSGMRWPIESCFEQAKGSLGMAAYQTRSWRGWHHHMTLVILAHHFLVRLKLKHKKGHRP
jgi:SRSO17 transposase